MTDKPEKKTGKKRIGNRRFFAIIIAVAAVTVFVVVLFTVKFGEYKSYVIELTDTKENTLVYSYHIYGTDIFKCASDTASLTNDKNETKWDVNFEMINPQVDICGKYILVYDKNGTGICICNENGEVGSFNTHMPIVTAEISDRGACAVLLDDGVNSEIDYYDSDGSLISTIRTAMDSDGYPMDIALSKNGLMICVSYLNMIQNMTVSELRVYNFGSPGQLVADNIIGVVREEGIVVPQVEFLNESICVAFGTSRIDVIKCGKTAEILKTLELDDEVRSTVVSEDYFGIIMTGNTNNGNEITLYDKNGTLKKSFETDFNYTNAEIKDEYVVLNNRNELCVYTTGGVRKFYGLMPGLIRQVQMINGTRFAVATTESYNIIRLQ